MFMHSANRYEISTDRSRLDVVLIDEFLHSSYWAKGICARLSSGRSSIRFASARISAMNRLALPARFRISPRSRTWPMCLCCRNIVAAAWRLYSCVPSKSTRSCTSCDGSGLITRDWPYALYAKCGFQSVPNPENFMTIHRPDVYSEERAF